MLYEMIAGQRPFTGTSDNDTIAAIFREEPAPLPTRGENGVPAGLRAVLDKDRKKPVVEGRLN